MEAITVRCHTKSVKTCLFVILKKTRNSFIKIKLNCMKTSLLRKLQTQTHPDEAPPMGKIHPFSKIAVTFEPVMRFGCLWDLEFPEKL